MLIQIEPLFEPVVLADSVGVLFTATVPTRIDKMTAVNMTGGSVSVTVYLVPSGSQANQNNLLVPAYAIDAETPWDVWPAMGHVLAVGDQIAAYASAGASVNCFCSGTTVSNG